MFYSATNPGLPMNNQNLDVYKREFLTNNEMQQFKVSFKK